LFFFTFTNLVIFELKSRSFFKWYFQYS
jgi:hypothetical protein